MKHERTPSLTWLLVAAAQVDTALRDLLERLLAKDPRERLTVPEARDHVWVRSWLERARRQSGDAVCGGGEGDSSLRGAPLLAESSRSSSSFSPHSRRDHGGPLFGAGSCAGAGVGGSGGSGDVSGWEGGGTCDRVAVTDEDIRAAVTRAPGFVVVVSGAKEREKRV